MVLMCLGCLVTSPAIAQTSESPAAREPRFDVYEYAVRGNTTLPVTAVERAVYPFLGEQRTIQDVEAARAALEKAYRDAGFQTVSVEIPEQQVQGGVVNLRVVEGRVDRVRVVGARYYSQGQILSRAPSVAAGGVPYFPAVQKDIAALNTSDNLRVLPVLRPGVHFGTTEIDLNVQDRLPLSWNAELNNYYSPNTTHLRFLAGARYDNLWQLQHSISAQVQVSPEDTSEVKAFSASYFAPLGGDRGYVGGYYVISRSNVAAVGDQVVLGNGDILGLRWIKPLPPSERYTHSLTLGIDYKDFQQNVTVPGQPGIEQPIQYVPLSASYTGTLQGKKGITAFTTGLTFGVSPLSASEEEFANKRFNATSNFVIWKWQAQRTQMLSTWLSAFGEIDGQLANQPLVSNEQFTAGGVTSVRGYLEAEEIGDDGAHASFELRANVPSQTIGSRIDELELHVFAEGAYLTIQDPLPGTSGSAWLASAGVGLRARAFGGMRLKLDVGVPFKSTLYTQAGDPRLQVSASYTY
jgi:hemolysin activation/secretion protein